MANIVRNVNTNATVTKILNGDMPDGVTSEDTVVIISDEVTGIYVTLMSALLLNTIPDGAPDELIEKRMAIFDDVVDCINKHRCCRLHRFINELNAITKDYQIDSSIWPNTKMRNNVFSFINDFWIWNPEERSSLLVIDEIDLDELKAQQEAAAIPVDGEVVTE